MRAREPRALHSRMGRAAVIALGSAATATLACGSEASDNESREQAAEPGPTTEDPNMNGQGGAGSPTGGGEGGLPSTDEPVGGQATSPPDEPMGVPEYGVPILPPDPVTPSPSPNMPPMMTPGVRPPPAPVATMPPPVVVEPEAPPQPEPSAVFDAGPVLAVDGGEATGDAGSPDAAPEPVAEPEPLVEPEPTFAPAYGVPAL
jgi:hypothetical protein